MSTNANNVHKVIDYNYFQDLQRKRIKLKSGSDDQLYDDIASKIKDLINNVIEEQISTQNHGAPHIIELERKCEYMERKLNKAVPYYSIIYMCVNSGIFSVALTLLILRFGFNIYVIDPYYLICAVIISLGLFATAVATLVDWKEYLKKNGKE